MKSFVLKTFYFWKIFSKKIEKKISLFQITIFFFKKKFFFKFFFQNHIFLSNKSYPKTTSFSNKKVLLWDVNIFEAFNLTLAKRNHQNEEHLIRSGYREKPSSAGKGSMRERHLCTTFKLRTNSFCLQRAGLKVLIKVTSKADRWNASEKSLQKIGFLLYFFQ